MFRSMRRIKQQFSTEECFSLLKSEKRGVLSVLGDDDYPYGIPLNFIFDESDNAIYFHGAKEGHKIDAIKKHNKASFCIFNQGYKNPDEWFYNVQSVIVFGKIELLEQSEMTKEKCENLGLKYMPTKGLVDETMSKHFNNVQMLKLSIEHITGKNIKEK